MQYEYKHVHFDYKLSHIFSRDEFNRELERVLNEQGRLGWDLKSSLWDNGWHAHLLFGRPKEDPWQTEDR